VETEINDSGQCSLLICLLNPATHAPHFTADNFNSQITTSKAQLPTRVQDQTFLYICICRGNPIGRQQRNPIWGLAQPPGPYIPSSQPQKPEACLKTCYNAATQAQTEYLKGRSRRLPLRGQPQNCPWLVPRSQVPCPKTRVPFPMSWDWPADKGKPIIFSCNICKSKKLNDSNLNSTTTTTTTYAPKNVSTSHVWVYLCVGPGRALQILQPKRNILGYVCVCFWELQTLIWYLTMLSFWVPHSTEFVDFGSLLDEHLHKGIQINLHLLLQKLFWVYQRIASSES